MSAEDVNTIYRADSVADHSTSAAPVAGTAVASIAAASLPAGVYDVECWVAATGTVAAATETDNFEFREGATVVASLPVIITSTTASTAYAGPYKFRRQVDGSVTLSVNATANATASSVYRALITATKVASITQVL